MAQSAQMAQSAPTDATFATGAAEETAKPEWEHPGPLARIKRAALSRMRPLKVLFFAMNVVMGVMGYIDNDDAGLSFAVAKCGGYMLDLQVAVIVLPTLLNLWTAVHRARTYTGWLPTDELINLHMHVAVYIPVATAIHIAGHSAHFEELFAEDKVFSMPLREKGSLSWHTLTGFFVTIGMAAMFLPAIIRRASGPVLRRLCGGYKGFLRVHKLVWPLVMFLLLLHGTVRTWLALFCLAVLLFIDKKVVPCVKHEVKLREAEKLPCDALRLTFDLPARFNYAKAGEYIRLALKEEGRSEEWHPFTLTSAPEDNSFSVLIRTEKEKDWCYALAESLTDGLHGQPCESSAAATDLEVGATQEEGTRAEGPSAIKEKIAMKVLGPFDAPATKAWNFQTVMLVGGGIGVTPYAAILRSIMLQSRSGRTSNPQKIHFYWVVRSQEMISWFHDLLNEVKESPAGPSVDINIYVTRPSNASADAPATTGSAPVVQPCFSRPKWEDIFSRVKEQCSGQTVGVFCCGPAAMSKELAMHSKRSSDQSSGTQFTLFKEEF